MEIKCGYLGGGVSSKKFDLNDYVKNNFVGANYLEICLDFFNEKLF